jgi:chorismate synthase
MSNNVRYMTAGESHGPYLTVIVDGLPAGISISEDLIRNDLSRRQEALGAGGRMSIETDKAVISSGVLAGKTTGAPIAMTIVNANHEAWKGKAVRAMTTPRPGHADFAAAVKYGYDDVRPALERASARETASRVAAGACCRAFLSQFGIQVNGRVMSIGGVECNGDLTKAETAIANARSEGDTLGGVIEVVAEGLPIGLGSFMQADRRLDGRIAGALMSIQAMKGVEFGDGFALAAKKGTEAMDGIESVNGARTTNRMGGLEAGVTNGMPLVVRVAMKPIPTTIKKQKTVDLSTGISSETVYERSDICPVPRAVVVVESVLCSILADALIEKIGGDSIDEMKVRFDHLPKSRTLSASPKVFWP